MNKALLLFCLCTVISLNQSAAQACVRDSSLLLSGDLLSPAPYSPDSPFYNLKTACIAEVYSQSVTVFVPDSFDYQGVIKVKILSVTLPPNAVSNMPTGMAYSCDPPNCTFQPMSLGCIQLQGTPSAQNMPDTFDLGITANVTTILGTFPIVFPGDAAPGNHYYLLLKEQGQCVSASSDPGSPFGSVRAMPNPVTGQTTIEVQSIQSGVFLFEVFDLFGKQMHNEKVQLYEGENRFSFDAGNLPAGTYLYTVGDANGKSVRRLVKI
ncbi:MAG: T9SS type A sorting domain-containing protein [Lewinellaceae bacterium]|nr:T9SS type A sorting domain-containing protein [Lewinellaceae bacterium]